MIESKKIILDSRRDSSHVVGLPAHNNTATFDFFQHSGPPFFFFFFAGRIDPVIWLPPNTDHMWVPHWQSDYIVEQAVEFIRKKLARRSAGLSPIGQSRGLLRLRAPQTFLWIIFSIPPLSSVRTDQIAAQGLHCEGLFKKVLFSMPSLFYAFPLSHLIDRNSKKEEKKKKKIPIMTFSYKETLNDCFLFKWARRTSRFSQSPSSKKSVCRKAQTM